MAMSVCPSARLSHSGTLLNLLDGMRCYLAGTLVFSSNRRLRSLTGRGDLGVGTPSSQGRVPPFRILTLTLTLTLNPNPGRETLRGEMGLGEVAGHAYVRA